jgi:GT2 family glycosyltransferase
MIDISVVIVNWNTKDFLLDCIQSIVDETLQHSFEVIVVDNGSSDGSLEAVRERFPYVKIIYNDSNMGFAKANNIGIGASKGEYICLVNSDIKLLHGCLDTMCDYMGRHREVGLLGPQILNKDLSIQASSAELPSLRSTLMQALALAKLFPRIRFCRTRFMSDFDHRSPRNVEVLSGCFLMARRDALQDVGLLDERFFIYKEDVDWSKRFRDARWQVMFYPEAKAIHYGGASSSLAPARFQIEMERANLQYWRKHHSWLAQEMIIAIGFIHYWLRICRWSVTYLFKRGRKVTARDMIKRDVSCLCWLGGFRRSGTKKAT